MSILPLNPDLDVLVRLAGQQVHGTHPLLPFTPTLGLYTLAATPRAYVGSRDLNSDSHAGKAHYPLSNLSAAVFPFY